MSWSIRARLTVWYSFVMVVVLVTGAIAVAIVQERLAYERLDGELDRLMLTLEGVMRTEFGEGLDLIAAAMRPVSRVLRRTEVSAGHSREASGLSSKPTIDSSRGMLIPERMATL